jgi:hypothetical protein
MCANTALGFCDTLQLLGYGTIFHMKGVMASGRIQFWADAMNALVDGDYSKVPTAADLDRETSHNRVSRPPSPESCIRVQVEITVSCG